MSTQLDPHPRQAAWSQRDQAESTAFKRFVASGRAMSQEERKFIGKNQTGMTPRLFRTMRARFDALSVDERRPYYVIER